MTGYKIGDRVRITEVWEGVLTSLPNGQFELDHGVTIHRGADSEFDVEVLETTEPEYEAGAMYVDEAGAFFAYWPEDDPEMPWVEPGTEDRIARDSHYIRRPLRKLVPEGEAK